VCLGAEKLSAQRTATSRELRQVWAAAIDVSGTTSRDGHFLAFVDWSSNDLAVRDLASGHDLRLTDSTTHRGSYPQSMSFSPDGREIAYTVGAESLATIRVISAAGGIPRVVYRGPAAIANVCEWTQDGLGLLVTLEGNRGKTELGVVTLADGVFRPRVVRRGIHHAGLSPDGRFVVYEEWSTKNPAVRDVRIVSMHDGKDRMLVSGADDWSPAWSRDGRGIFFVSSRAGGRGVWYVRVSNGALVGTPRRFAALTSDMSILGISESGTVYLGEEGFGLTTFTAVVRWPGGLVDGITELSTPPFRDARRAVFSPDGRALAYPLKSRSYVVRPGWFTPTVKRLEDRGERMFPTTLTLRDEPMWFPEGRSLLVVNDEAGSGEGSGPPWTFWRLSLDSGTYRKVGASVNPGLVRIGGLTGQHVVYKRTEYNDAKRPVSTVESLDLRTGSTSELYRVTGDVISDVALSRIGSRIAFTLTDGKGGSTIGLLTLGRSEPTTIATLARTNARAQLMWFADDRALLISGQIGVEQGLWRVPVDGSAPEKLKIDAAGITEARLSPDGNRIVFTVRSKVPHRVWAFDSNVPAMFHTPAGQPSSVKRRAPPREAKTDPAADGLRD
jgi:Tol biopolymer transport system component